MGTRLTGDPRDVALRDALYSLALSGASRRQKGGHHDPPQGFITRHPVPTYFALTFAISWGGATGLVGSVGLPGTAAKRSAVSVWLLAMLAGPSLAGLLLTGSSPADGPSRVSSRVLTWRVAARGTRPRS